MSPKTFNRREFVGLLGGAALTGLAPWQSALAETTKGPAMMLVILRGALDGLAAVVPYHERRLKDWRSSLVPPEPGDSGGALALGIDGFALHPSMEFMHSAFRDNQLSILHAASSAYRERSHFDGQDVLENGSDAALAIRDGWLNRALSAMPQPVEAAAVSAAIPLVLKGDAHATSWAPSVLPEPDDDTLARLMKMYQRDTSLQTALQDARALGMAAGDIDGDARGIARGRDYVPLMEAGANLISSGAAGVVVLSLSGWDTHNNQGSGTGVLANRLKQLDDGLAAVKKALASRWDQTAIVVATEFGRTVRANGSRGSDHGTGGASFLLGGAVNGGRMLGDWPGLASRDLYESRDLYPANDLRSLFKGVLQDHLGIDRSDLDRAVFPSSQQSPPLDGLIV